MIKKLLFLLIILLAAASQSFAAENNNASIYDSFKTYCGTEMARVLDTYKGEQYSIVYKSKSNKPESWIKCSENVESAYGIEMQKAAAPGQPDVGILIVKQSTSFYVDNYDSEQGAKAETTVANTAKSVYKFFMSYQNNEWVLTKVMKYTHWQKKWRTETPTSVFEILQSKNEIKQ